MLETKSLSEQKIPITPEFYPAQAPFIETLESTAELLNNVGIPPQKWMVISGGSVALRQMQECSCDVRVPTDLDIVIDYQDPEQADEILTLIHQNLTMTPGFDNTQLIREPRSHYGFIFPNPILESRYRNHGSLAFPIDFLTKMTTIFPQDAHIPLLRGVSYDFPISDILFDHAEPIKIGNQQTPVQAAHPAFVVFYKLSMNRNGCSPDGHGSAKQDDGDLCTMNELGLINLSDNEFMEIFNIMSGHNPVLTEQLTQALQVKINRNGTRG